MEHPRPNSARIHCDAQFPSARILRPDDQQNPPFAVNLYLVRELTRLSRWPNSTVDQSFGGGGFSQHSEGITYPRVCSSFSGRPAGVSSRRFPLSHYKDMATFLSKARYQLIWLAKLLGATLSYSNIFLALRFVGKFGPSPMQRRIESVGLCLWMIKQGKAG